MILQHFGSSCSLLHLKPLAHSLAENDHQREAKPKMQVNNFQIKTIYIPYKHTWKKKKNFSKLKKKNLVNLTAAGNLQRVVFK